MTRETFSVLTRHFASSILTPPILTDLGADYWRRTLSGLLGILIVTGIFLPRLFSRKYIELYALVPRNCSPASRAGSTRWAWSAWRFPEYWCRFHVIAVVLCPLFSRTRPTIAC